jgi:hypothetical protein
MPKIVPELLWPNDFWQHLPRLGLTERDHFRHKTPKMLTNKLVGIFVI